MELKFRFERQDDARPGMPVEMTHGRALILDSAHDARSCVMMMGSFFSVILSYLTRLVAWHSLHFTYSGVILHLIACIYFYYIGLSSAVNGGSDLGYSAMYQFT